jgi:glycine dehydrogenase subunit 1
MALYVTIYMSLMGKQGVKEAAEQSYAGAHYLYDELLKTGRFKPAFNQPFFNEFCVTYDGDIDALQEECLDAGFLAGVKVDDHTLMLAVTEQRTREEIDELIEVISAFSE